VFIRDPWSTETWQQRGPVVINALSGDPVGTPDQVMLQQLHALAVAIYQAQQDAKAAQERGDIQYATNRIQEVARLRDQFQVLAHQFVGVDALGGVDAFILKTGTWVEQSMKALPGALAAIPSAFGQATFMALLPWVGAGLLVLWFLGRAEKSRTFSKYVA
jgi:hypothetical protein